MDTATDRRQFERFDVVTPVRLKIQKSGDNDGTLLFETHNLSAGGAFIKTTGPLPEGCPVKMEIFLDFSEAEGAHPPKRLTVILVSGRVIRSTNHGMAICFLDDYDIVDTAHTECSKGGTKAALNLDKFLEGQ